MSQRFSKEFRKHDWSCPMNDRKLDPVVAFLIKSNLSLTLKNYLQVAYMGDKDSLAEVGPEDIGEIEELLAANEIVDTESEGIN
jgi:hypothetical protein